MKSVKDVMGLVFEACDASEYQQFNKAYAIRQVIEAALRELVERKPMSDDEVAECCREANRGYCIDDESYFKAFRDVERAHNIGA